MGKLVNIAIVGDRDNAITAHRAIPIALANAACALDVDLSLDWLASDAIDGIAGLQAYDAFWVAPGSPYRSLGGALLAITHARTSGRPFLGTCGGFQHAVLEYARNVMGWKDAGHGETDGEGRLVITPLACEMVEKDALITFLPASIPARAYGALQATEGYRCRYGINSRFLAELSGSALKMVGFDAEGEVRAFELTGHSFFAGTLFQPERTALRGRLPPMVGAFIRAAADRGH